MAIIDDYAAIAASSAALRQSGGPRLPPPPSNRLFGPSSRTNAPCKGRPLATCYIGG